jgi:hypothetical protein
MVIDHRVFMSFFLLLSPPLSCVLPCIPGVCSYIAANMRKSRKLKRYGLTQGGALAKGD